MIIYQATKEGFLNDILTNDIENIVRENLLNKAVNNVFKNKKIISHLFSFLPTSYICGVGKIGQTLLHVPFISFFPEKSV